MTKVIYRIFANYEKEEVWLNEMAARGLNCTGHFFGRYTFERGTPGEYIYRLEFLEYPTNHKKGAAYLEFLKETGVEVVSHSTRWVYLRKKAAAGPFEIFTDKASRLKHYKRILTLLAPIAFFNLFFGISFFWQRRGISLANMAAFLFLNFPILTYYRRFQYLKKESVLRE